MKVTILGDPSLVIFTLYIVCLNYAWVNKKMLKEIMYFHYATYMATPERKNPTPGFYSRLGGSVEIGFNTDYYI